MTTKTHDDATHVRALGQGINLTDIRKFMPELEALCNRKIEAAEEFKNAIQVRALTAGLLPGTLLFGEEI